MHIYTEALAQYAGENVTPEIEEALGRVKAKHHARLVAEVAELTHEELMDARMDGELAGIVAGVAE